jgi:DNA-binding NtrC family response regulator
VESEIFGYEKGAFTGGLGSNQERESDFRLICATNQNLDHAVEEGDFREDLFYRINTFPIHLPPLKQRRDDIVLLANHYLQVFAEKNRKPSAGIDDSAMELMTAHEWRGNVRELQNVLESALILAGGESICVDDLPEAVKRSGDREAEAQVEYYLDLPFKDAKERLIEGFERRYITEVLKNFKGNISRSAEHSGIDRRSLHRLLSKYHIDAHQVAK